MQAAQETGPAIAIAQASVAKKKVCRESNIPSRFKPAGFSSAKLNLPDTGNAHTSHAGVVWLPAGNSKMGADN